MQAQWYVSVAALKRGHTSYDTLRLWNNHLMKLCIDELCINEIMFLLWFIRLSLLPLPLAPDLDVLKTWSNDSKLCPLSCDSAETSLIGVTVVVMVHIVDDHKTHFHLFSGAPEAQIPSQRHCQTLWRKIKQSFAKKSSRSSGSRCADAETYKTFVTKNGGWWRDGRFW